MNYKCLLAVLDGIGIHGAVFHWAMVMAFMGSAILGLIYFWRKGRLDCDESPKFEMIQNDDTMPLQK